MLHRFVLFLMILVAIPFTGLAQSAGGVRGQVLDPSKAVVPGASLTLTAGANVYTTKSDQDGVYSFHEVPAGVYFLTVDADGFAHLTKNNITIAATQTRQLDVTVAIAVQQQDVTVTDRSAGVSVNPARSLGPALFAGRQALSQVWLFFVAPFLGALLAGLLFRIRLLDAETEIPVLPLVTTSAPAPFQAKS